MSLRAKYYIGGVLVIGLILSLTAATTTDPNSGSWTLFAVLATFATGAHLFQVLGPSHEAWNFNLIFYFCGLILLTPAQFVILLIVPHVVEWIKARMGDSNSLRSWYIQPFNVSVHLISAWISRLVLFTFERGAPSLTSTDTLIAISIGAMIYALLNHLLIGQALVWARGASWRELGVLELGNFVPDVALLLQGYILAVVWQFNPWLLLPALAPLILMYRSLSIPKLQSEARTDDKTGLWNARHIREFLDDELERAKRTMHPLSVVMADLDLLRVVNNKYGHLAGDQVLAEVGRLIRASIAEHHVAGRFGGEEFCIVMPDTAQDAAQQFATNLRIAVDNHRFQVSNSDDPIHVTISSGVSCFPNDGATATGLVHAADVALYQAKYHGRNRVVCATQPAQIRPQNSAYGAAEVPQLPVEAATLQGTTPDEATTEDPSGEPDTQKATQVHKPNRALSRHLAYNPANLSERVDDRQASNPLHI